MMWGGEARLLLNLQVKTDGGPVKLTPGRVAMLLAREVGYKYPPLPPHINRHCFSCGSLTFSWGRWCNQHPCPTAELVLTPY